MRRIHCSLACLLLVTVAAVAAAQDPPARSPNEARFIVFLRGAAIGSEQVTVERTADGIVITGAGRLAPPINIVTRRFEMVYDLEWQPQRLALEGVNDDRPFLFNVTFGQGQATVEYVRGTERRTLTTRLAPRAVVLPNEFLGSYEALAARLAGATPGTVFSAFVPPEAEVPARLDAVLDERISTLERTIAAKRYQLTLLNPTGELGLEVWADESNRLLRVAVPRQGFESTRQDIASISARRETLAREGDEQEMIPAAGFSLAATITKPAGKADRYPAVVLVPGSSPIDRDETVAGIPIFAQLANALGDAGFLVVRYDKRGLGQSGGRAESATLADYAEDVRAVVRWLARRKDVDEDRIAVAGHGEGAWMALEAAEREKRIAAVALLAAPGTTGAELVLEQQREALEKMSLPQEEKEAKIALQKKIQRAVVDEGGWEEVPAAMRRLADTPWFESFLTFDPAGVMRDVKDPVLILHGELDRQIPVAHADRLAAMARARKKELGQMVAVERVPNVNHLLVPAVTGEIEEYGALAERQVSPKVTAAIVTWLQRVMPAPAGNR